MTDDKFNSPKINTYNIGVAGDGTVVYGGIHFHSPQPSPYPPLQRLPRAEYFIGRQSELEQLLTALQISSVVTVCGPGGIGKTALVAEAICELAPNNVPPEHFPDGILFHSFYNKPDVSYLFEHIVRSYDPSAQDISQAAAYRILSNKRALLVLDGAEVASDLREVLEIRGMCGVLITSRNRKDAFARRLDLLPLSENAAISLLQAWRGNRSTDEKVVLRICELVGYLPLALRLAGRYLSQTNEPIEKYLTWLETSPLEALNHGQRREESIPILLAKSIDQVSTSARNVLALIGLLAFAPFTQEVIAMGDRGFDDLQHSLDELLMYGFLICEDNLYRVNHPLIHTYAYERLVCSEDTLSQLVTYCIKLVWHEKVKKTEKNYLLDVLRPHFVSLLELCINATRWKLACQLTGAIEDYLGLRGAWVERVNVLQLGIHAARQVSAPDFESIFLSALGNAYNYLGQMEQALESQELSLDIVRALGDKYNEGMTLSNLGGVYHALGQTKLAIDYYEQALLISQQIHNRHNEGSVLGNLGGVYRDLGQMELAIRYCEQALMLARETNDLYIKCSVLGHLGNLYRDLDQASQAIDCYQKAITIAQKVGDRHNECVCWSNLGNVHYDLMELEVATDYYKRALSIAREIGDRRSEGANLGNL